MRNLKVLAVGVIGLAAAGGGIVAAATDSSSPHASAAGNAVTAATVDVATATVNGKTEKILVDDQGLPLYTYAGDSPTTSAVSGQLAALWPPLDSAAPSESGTNGNLSVVRTGNGAQVQYNGRFLYSFISDSRAHVTGQGVQNFFVATPADAPATAPGTPATRAGGSSGGYGAGY